MFQTISGYLNCIVSLLTRHFLSLPLLSKVPYFSSTSWCNLAPSFHEYESVVHKLLHKWHQHSLTPSHKTPPSPNLLQHYLASTPFFVTADVKQPTLLNSMIPRRTQNSESSTNVFPDPQIVLAGLKNKPHVTPPLLLYVVLPNYVGWSFP